MIGEPHWLYDLEMHTIAWDWVASEEIKQRLLKTGKAVIQHFELNDATSELLYFLR